MQLRYDTSPLGTADNWVNKTGGLDPFIRAVAHALERAGHSESESIQLAIGVIKRWASGGGYVTAKTRAKAAAAVAHWEAQKAAAHAGRSDDVSLEPRAVAEFGPGGAGAVYAGNNPDSSGAALLLPLADPKKPKPREAELIGPHRYIPNVGNVKQCAKCGKGPLASVHKDWAKVKQVATVKRDSVATVEALLGRPVESRHRGPDHVHVPTGHANTPVRKRLAMKQAHKAALAGYEQQFAEPMKALFAKQQVTTLSRLNGRRGRVMVRRATEAILEARASSQPGPMSGPPSDGVPVTTAAPAGPAAPPTIDVAALFDSQFWLGKTIAALEPGYRATAAGATSTVRAQLGTPVTEEMHSLSNAQVRAALMARAQSVGEQVNRTTLTQLATAIADGMEKGESIPQLAERVKGVFQDANDVRATRLARTEATAASNAAQNTYAENLPLGIVAGKEWISVADQRRREDHKLADGQKQPLGVPFRVGGFAMQHPGDSSSAPPSETINCRCTTAFIPQSQSHLLLQQPPKDFNPNPEIAA